VSGGLPLQVCLFGFGGVRHFWGVVVGTASDQSIQVDGVVWLLGGVCPGIPVPIRSVGDWGCCFFVLLFFCFFCLGGFFFFFFGGGVEPKALTVFTAVFYQ